MIPVARILLAVTASVLCSAAGAQTFKCLNAAGKITYTNGKCGDLGLKDAGEVPDRLNVNPAYQPAPQPPQRSERPAAAGRGEAPAPRPAETPAPPQESDPAKRHCFVVKTPTGSVTRCNDKPDE
jgi:hypothetical protein